MIDDNDFKTLLEASSLGGPKPPETGPIAHPDPFRDVLRGRCWHARHMTAQTRGRYLAASVCGTNLLSSSETIPGPFPPKSNNCKPCGRCLWLSDPSTLPHEAFLVLQHLIKGKHLIGWPRSTRRSLNQLIERDLVALPERHVPGSSLDYQPTQLGWRNWKALRNHPAFDPELFK